MLTFWPPQHNTSRKRRERLLAPILSRRTPVADSNTPPVILRCDSMDPTTVGGGNIAARADAPSRHQHFPRPEIPRQRSNSVPLAVGLMDCTEEEAGLLFSAAEKASARRRKAQSVDDARNSPTEAKPTRLKELPRTPLYENVDLDDDSDERVLVATPPSRDEVKTPPAYNMTISSPPMPPQIKSYNDDMVKFVKQRLQDICIGVAASPESTHRHEADPQALDVLHRPPLTSRFSNWSNISTPAGDEDLVDADGHDEEDEEDIIHLANSPPPMAEDSPYQLGSSEQSSAHVEYAQVIKFRRKEQLEVARTASPSYFSFPVPAKTRLVPAVAASPKADRSPLAADVFAPPISSGPTPLINLDAAGVLPPVGPTTGPGAGFFSGFTLGGDASRGPTPENWPLVGGPLPTPPRSVRC